MLRRLQNLLLLAWALVLLLFLAFNWSLVWREIPIRYLFMDVPLQPFLWLLVGGLGVAGALRVLAAMEERALRRHAEREVNRIKAEALDAHTREVEQIAERVHQRLEQKLPQLMQLRAQEEAAAAAPAEGPAKP